MTSVAGSSETTQNSWLEGNVRLIEVPRFDDARGSLVPFEFEQLPFLPRRMFVVRDVPIDTVRGRHALMEQQQFLVCLVGAVEVEARLHNHRQTIALDRPDVGLLIEPGIWSSQRFVADGSVLLGLASGDFDPQGYATEGVDPVG